MSSLKSLVTASVEVRVWVMSSKPIGRAIEQRLAAIRTRADKR